VINLHSKSQAFGVAASSVGPVLHSFTTNNPEMVINSFMEITLKNKSD
jgi:hypothetical protein